MRLTSRYVCRLLNHMDRHGFAVCAPRLPSEGVERRPLLDFTSGYVKRAEAGLPKQGARPPWRLHQNYIRDLLMLRLSPVTDEAMEFGKAVDSPKPARQLT